jgi:hypothetical protein
MISKSLSTSRKYSALYAEAGELAEFCQSLFPLIVAHADDFGRLPGDVFTVRHLVLPASPRSLEQFNAALTAMNHVGLIQRYRVAGSDYLQVVKFEEHQVGLSRRTKSKFPRPQGNSVKFTEIHSELNRTELNSTEQNLTEPNRTELNGNTNGAAAAPMDVLFDRFQSTYPPHRRQGDYLTQQAFVDGCGLVGFDKLMSALEQHKRSEQWQTPKLVIGMRTWLQEKRWNQVLPEPGGLSDNGRASMANAERLLDRLEGK